MKHALMVAGAGALVVVVLFGCSGAVSVSSGDNTIRVWPTADPLTGPLMVGRWMCTKDLDYAAMRQSNRVAQTQFRCNTFIDLARAMEVLPDGSGRALSVYEGENRAPEDSFKIEGSGLFFQRGLEFRWQYNTETTVFHMQTTVNRNWDVEILRPTENVLRIDPHGTITSNRLLFRIGSPEYRQLATFLNCVQENNGRNLFDVVDCGEPY